VLLFELTIRAMEVVKIVLIPLEKSDSMYFLGQRYA
jgi:hypothetical protein